MRDHPMIRRVVAGVFASGLVLGAAACGDDDDDVNVEEDIEDVGEDIQEGVEEGEEEIDEQLDGDEG